VCSSDLKEPDQFVFASLAGKPLRGDTIIVRIRVVAEKLNLPQFRWHSLRRTGETILHDSGAPIKTQSQMLGHVNPSITLLYAQDTGAGKEQASKLLAQAICPNLPQAPERVA
jgi:integrase